MQEKWERKARSASSEQAGVCTLRVCEKLLGTGAFPKSLSDTDGSTTSRWQVNSCVFSCRSRMRGPDGGLAPEFRIRDHGMQVLIADLPPMPPLPCWRGIAGLRNVKTPSQEASRRQSLCRAESHYNHAFVYVIGLRGEMVIWHPTIITYERELLDDGSTIFSRAHDLLTHTPATTDHPTQAR